MVDPQTAKILQAISLMTQSEGWAFLKRDFENVTEALQLEINEPGGNEMKYSEGDLLKIRLKMMKDILEYPDRFRTLATSPKEEDHDPYK